jgi:hypothetical protein
MPDSPLPPDTQVAFELVLRYRTSQHALVEQQRQRLLAGASTAGQPDRSADRSADPNDVAAVKAFAARAGLDVVQVDEAARRVRVSGTAAAIAGVFKVRLVNHSSAEGSWRECDGTPQIPLDLQPIVEGVLGLSERPAASR